MTDRGTWLVGGAVVLVAYALLMPDALAGLRLDEWLVIVAVVALVWWAVGQRE